MHERRAKARVLVVEDSLTQAKKLEVILQSVGFEVVVARDGRQGIDAFRTGPFDLVLSDVVMPGISGYDLCRTIKSSPGGEESPGDASDLAEQADRYHPGPRMRRR